jgi:hypothetical protein
MASWQDFILYSEFLGLKATGLMVIPSGATAARPTGGDLENGLIYINTDVSTDPIIEWYYGGSWHQPGTGGGSVGTLEQVTDLGNTTTNNILLQPADPATDVAVASPELWFTSKRDDSGFDDTVDWRLWQETTDSFGSSTFYIQRRLNAGAWGSMMTLLDNGSVRFKDATTTGNYSFAHGNGSEARASSGVIASQNADAFGDRSFIASGQNFVIQAGATGAAALATDGKIYGTGTYSVVLNDANENWSTASLTTGFGNDNYVENGLLGGSDNVLGHTSNDGLGTGNNWFIGFMYGLQNRATGNHTYTLGKYLYPQGNGIMAFGSGVSTANRMALTEVDSFNVGFNSTVPSFIVHAPAVSGVGAVGMVEVAHTLKVGSISQDDTETKLVVWNSTDKILEWRDVSTISGGSYTDEQAQDAVAAMVVDTATINFTYTDATPELKADLIVGAVDNTETNFMMWTGTAIELRTFASLGISDTNFANTNLTFTAGRTHDASNFSLEIINIDFVNLIAGEASLYLDRAGDGTAELVVANATESGAVGIYQSGGNGIVKMQHQLLASDTTATMSVAGGLELAETSVVTSGAGGHRIIVSKDSVSIDATTNGFVGFSNLTLTLKNLSTSSDANDKMMVWNTTSKEVHYQNIPSISEPIGQVVWGTGTGVDSVTELFWHEATKRLLLDHPSGYGTSANLELTKHSASGAYPFLFMNYGNIGSMSFGNASSSGFAPTINFKPDGTTWNVSFFNSETLDTGAYPALFFDGRKVAGALTTQDVVGFGSYTDLYMVMKANKQLRLHYYGDNTFTGTATTWAAFDTNGNMIEEAIPQKAIQFQDEGSNLGTSGTVTEIDFVGAGVTASRATNKVTVTIGGGVGSGITRTVVVTSGATSMGSAASTDYVYFVAGAHTMSLPAAAGNTNRYTVKNNHTADITIDTAGAENIEGAASIVISPEDSVDIVSDGTNWWVI